MTNNNKTSDQIKHELEGCELKQLGTREVFFCPTHEDDMNAKSGDKEIDSMVDYQMNK